MKFAAAAIVAVSFAAETMATTLGQSCVNSNLVKVFNAVNSLRKEGTASATYTMYAATSTYNKANTGVWLMSQNSANAAAYKVNVVSGDARVAASLAVLDAIGANPASPVAPIKWVEGLATGNDEFVAEYVADPSFSSLTAPSGSTTISRATESGTVTGKVTEVAYFYDTYSSDSNDMMRFILTNDGSSGVRDPLVKKDSTYKAMSAGFGSDSSCTMSAATPTACKSVLIVTAAEDYANGSVTACQPTVSYGGGICDPDAFAMTVFEQL